MQYKCAIFAYFYTYYVLRQIKDTKKQTENPSVFLLYQKHIPFSSWQRYVRKELASAENLKFFLIIESDIAIAFRNDYFGEDIFIVKSEVVITALKGGFIIFC